MRGYLSKIIIVFLLMFSPLFAVADMADKPSYLSATCDLYEYAFVGRAEDVESRSSYVANKIESIIEKELVGVNYIAFVNAGVSSSLVKVENANAYKIEYGWRA